MARSNEAEGIGYDIFFAASNNTWRIFDTSRARQMLGYVPADDAESYP